MVECSNKVMDMRFENGLLYSTYKEGVVIDLDAATTSINDRKKLSNYKVAPILVDARHMVKLTKEARNYFGSEEGYDLLSAAAILTDSALSAAIVNFFIKVNLQKASIPVKMFTDREKALNWLEQYK